MSQGKDTSEGTPYRTKIETGGKVYKITNGPGEKRFLFQSTVFQDGSPKVKFTVETLGEVSCIVTGFNKSFMTNPLPLDQYMFFGITDRGVLCVGFYCLTANRTGWIKFYTPKELKESDPILAHILG